MADTLKQKHDRLLRLLRDYESVAVAFSGGVDSAVVAKAAHLALGDQSVAVTGTSASLAEGELALAEQVAALIGIRHHVINTDEFANPNYVRNASDRCFHCKTELYDQIRHRMSELNVKVVVNGANVDDLGDHRPGMRAAADFQVQSPLATCGFAKADIRELAAEWGLPVHDKPATPCLSSRVAYGEEVTPERLRMIDQSEQYMRELGFSICRVRYHRGDLARVEVPFGELGRLVDAATCEAVQSRLKQIGFRFVTIDLEGFRSGSLNELIPVESLVTNPVVK
jgi:uncharacterized protein